MTRDTETHGYCPTCRVTYRRDYPHACNTVNVDESRARLERWLGEAEIYE